MSGEAADDAGYGDADRYEARRRRLRVQRKAPAKRRPESADEPPEYEHGAAPGTLGSIAPVQGNPSLDPAGSMLGPARMAGWSPAAADYDALQGVGELATPGGPDATRELLVSSSTEGGPLDLAPDESAFDDTLGRGTHSLSLDEGERGDWTVGLRLAPDEGCL
jgi:hypothetical protein